MSVGVGDAAPDFTLPATGGGTVSLHDFAGRPVVLVFYPGDDTPVCTKQLNTYNDEFAQFEQLDAHVLGISAQGVESHEKFSGKHGFKFPLLADTDKKVAGLYGTLGPIGFPRRSVFIIRFTQKSFPAALIIIERSAGGTTITSEDTRGDVSSTSWAFTSGIDGSADSIVILSFCRQRCSVFSPRRFSMVI